MSPYIAGFVGIAVFVVILLLRMPVAVSMALVGFAGISYLTNTQAAFRILSSELYSTFSSYSLSVTPMFILMGLFAFHAGIGSRLYKFAYQALGHLRGGLAMATELACAIFGAVSGSSPATAATIGSIAIPEMRKYKYRDKLATASVAAGGAIGILIPPSVPLVVYGIITENSISKLFLGAILPGVLLTLFYMGTIWVSVKSNPSLAPVSSGPRPGIKTLFNTLKGSILDVLIIFIISVGLLFWGIVTPTECGAVGAAGVLLVTLIRKDMNWIKFRKALEETTRTTAMIMFLIGGATIFSRFLTLSRIPFEIADWVAKLPLQQFVIILIIMVIYIFLGMIIDAIPLILITVPIFYPVVVDTLGFDPIWFGVMNCFAVAIGVITPPVGVNVFVIKGIFKDISLETIFSGVFPFLAAALLCFMLIAFFPQIVAFLPAIIMP